MNVKNFVGHFVRLTRDYVMYLSDYKPPEENHFMTLSHNTIVYVESCNVDNDELTLEIIGLDLNKMYAHWSLKHPIFFQVID